MCTCMRMYVCMYVCMYVRIYACMYVRTWAKNAAAFMAECKVHNRDFSAGTVTILRTKQQEFNSRRGERQATKLRAYRASLVHSGQQ